MGDWLSDPNLTLVGYQVNFEKLETGALLFNHNCQTTLALCVKEFNALYNGPIFAERATGTDQCPEHCLHRDNLEPCPMKCECNYVREIVQIIKAYPKKRG